MKGLITSVLILALTMISCGNDSSFTAGEQNRRLEPSEGDPTPDTSDKVPAGAIVQGAFTVWTEPNQPVARQPYYIVVKVQLPSAMPSYSKSDLSGGMVGTDNYKRDIHPPKLHPLNALDKFEFSGGDVAIMRLYVPGAEKLVKDVITVKSALLNEQQSIEIVFQ